MFYSTVLRGKGLMTMVKNWLRMATAAVCFVICAYISAGVQAAEKRDTLYQVSTISALLSGMYDQVITVDELIKYGDFGIGTFAGLDGEMVVLDGKVYKVAGTGAVTAVAADEGVPFAVITYFDADSQLPVENIASLEQLYKTLPFQLSNRNLFYAVRVDGEFTYVKTRSVPKQQKPYPPLTAVTPSQAVFETSQVKGTLIGFWSPDFVKGLNVTGFHLHFISDDRMFGGHLLDCRIKTGIVKIDDTHEFHLALPVSKEFQQVSLDKDWEADIAKVEK